MNADDVMNRILATLDEVEHEVEADFDEDREDEDPGAPPGRERLDHIRETLAQILKSRTEWLQAGAPASPVYGSRAPAFYLDYMEQVFHVLLARTMVRELPHAAPRLLLLPSLILQGNPPTECRICLGEAATCYLFGQFRPSAVLARTAMEAAIRRALRDAPDAAIPIGEDSLSRAIQSAGELGILSVEGVGAGHHARKIGNMAAHGKDIGEREARDMLIAVRYVIAGMFPGESEVDKGGDAELASEMRRELLGQRFRAPTSDTK